MIYKDYYKDLGVTAAATPAEIKRAYRTLAKKYHPDKARGDARSEMKFKEVNEANEVLSDAVKRKKYDQFGAEWKQYEQSGSRPGGFDWSKYPGAGGNPGRQTRSGPSEQRLDDDTVNDLFEMLFGRRGGTGDRRRTSAVQGRDVKAEMTLTLEEAYRGTVRLLRHNDESIRITIKPGVEDRQQLRMSGKGEPGRSGGMPGDVIITIVLLPHPVFRRIGSDLHCILPVGLYSALLGGAELFTIMDKRLKITIRAGTQNGTELSLKGLGMPHYGKDSLRGNVVLSVSIVLPDGLSAEEIALFTSLAGMRKSSGGSRL